MLSILTATLWVRYHDYSHFTWGKEAREMKEPARDHIASKWLSYEPRQSSFSLSSETLWYVVSFRTSGRRGEREAQEVVQAHYCLCWQSDLMGQVNKSSLFYVHTSKRLKLLGHMSKLDTQVRLTVIYYLSFRSLRKIPSVFFLRMKK